ncbi:replicative DNA helicase [Campylobacter concisus]|uniref:Replicative DNA helicase n=1 Tax=Campylobacter concisus TaxID=199 RepID=A0A7S9RU05_9BACT|nr:replicative DNA helicase [Campylobacter concisus]QPH97858.1 replicative DNA helicase [Campylobacter concisus]QPI05055.1 replicative DNA helicase [Campylobacter concisus]
MAKERLNEIEFSNLYDLDMERAILSSILQNNDTLGEIFDTIKAKDFYLKGHSQIYEAMVECLNSDDPVAVPFLKNKLGDKYDEALMIDIIGTNSLIDIRRYASELKEKSIKRSLVKIAHDIPSKVNEDKASRDMVDELSQEFYSLIEGGGTGTIKEGKDIILKVVEHIKTQIELGEQDIVGLDTGFKKLNEMIKGFKNGDLIIVAARPGMGKTTLCLNFMSQVLKSGTGVVFFSLEMPAEQIMMRILSSKTSIPLQDIMTGKIDDEAMARLSDACGEFSEYKLFVHDSGYVNIHQVRTQMRKLKAMHPEISLCVIDYIGLMMSTNNFADRHIQIAEISRGLKLLARELDMPIIALSQLNRSLESRANKRPMLSDLRESGAIEQDADIILFVYRDEFYLEQEEKEKEKRASAEGKEYKSTHVFNKLQEKAEIIVGKNRNGETGSVDVLFQKQHSRFEDITSAPVSDVTFEG